MQLLRQTLALLYNTFAKGQVGVSFEIHVGKTVVTADASQLKQVFLNVILNAVEAMENSEKKQLTLSIENGRSLDYQSRYRFKPVQHLAAEHNRMIRIFEDANLKLLSVFSDVAGKTCTSVIEHVIAGDTDPEYPASLCSHWCLKSTQKEIALAVEGKFRVHHKFMLCAIRLSMEHLADEIKVLDDEITRRMQPFEEEIERLCQIPGINQTSAKDLLAEIGVDLEVFPSAAHLASWAGVSPGNNESTGKKKFAYESRQ